MDYNKAKLVLTLLKTALNLDRLNNGIKNDDITKEVDEAIDVALMALDNQIELEE